MNMVTPVQRYFEIINKNKATSKSSISIMKIFENYSKLTLDEFVKLPENEIEDLIFNYIVHLKIISDNTGKYQNSFPQLMAPIKLLLVQADILLNWAKIKSYYPNRRPLSNQLPYTKEHIKEMFKIVNCPRDIAFIHLLASTGVRIGGVFDLTCGDVKYIEDGAVITIYGDTTSEYRVCLTPEATTELKNYLATRNNIDEHDPLFTVRNNSRKLTDASIKDIMKRIKDKIGLNDGKGHKSKNAYSSNHAFRKRVEIIFSKVGIESSFKSYLTNHDMKVSVYSYFRGIDDYSLYQEFKKAIPELTIDENERLKLKHESEKQELTQKIPDKVKEKLEFIENQVVEMEKSYGKVVGALEVEVFVARMKTYFLNQLEGRGHVHIDKKYISKMGDFVNADPSSEALKVLGVDGELLEFMMEWESLAKDKKSIT